MYSSFCSNASWTRGFVWDHLALSGYDQVIARSNMDRTELNDSLLLTTAMQGFVRLLCARYPTDVARLTHTP